MRKKLFGVRPTNKTDVYLAAGAAVMALIAFISTLNEYKSDQDETTKENNS